VTRNHLAVAFLPFLAVLGAGSPPADATGSNGLPTVAIKAENAKWAAAFKRGDYKAIGMLYTAGGALLPQGEPRVIGGAAIEHYFAQAHAGKKPDSVSFSDYEFYGDSRTVTEVTNVAVHGPDGKLKLRGKQMLLFVKQGDAWKLHRDIWNADPS
jgi:ketosteroid isomerase-like protein